MSASFGYLVTRSLSRSHGALEVLEALVGAAIVELEVGRRTELSVADVKGLLGCLLSINGEHVLIQACYRYPLKETLQPV
jgi:hypothetical protein